jgi:asparagine synthase (glutamine-hydrolysing)
LLWSPALSIIDTSSAGHEPMFSRDGRFTLTFNGEIYNYRELRAELETKGHAFRTQTDIEVLLTAWQEWGEASLKRLNGMFAFALWDEKERALFLGARSCRHQAALYACQKPDRQERATPVSVCL